MSATMTTARTSGPTRRGDAEVRGRRLAGLGSAPPAAPAARRATIRGGRLNATAPDGPTCRRRSSPSGRSSSRRAHGQRDRAELDHAARGELGGLARRRSRRRRRASRWPSSRSMIVPAPCASSSSPQWRREIVSSSIAIVLSRRGRSTSGRRRARTSRPASRPVRTTSSSGAGGAARPTRSGASTAPSCRPASMRLGGAVHDAVVDRDRRRDARRRAPRAARRAASPPGCAGRPRARGRLQVAGERRASPTSLEVCMSSGLRWHPGTVLDGRYRIEQEVARGGMGVVYRATHVTLDLTRAVKVITPQFARDPRYLERFRIEATAAARIEHPNVVGRARLRRGRRLAVPRHAVGGGRRPATAGGA